MTDAVDRALVRELAAALQKLEPPVQRRFARMGGVRPDADAAELALHLGDPAFARGAVRTLDAPARALLRLVARLAQPVAARELDLVAEMLAPGSGAAGTASEQLCAAGLAALDDQRPPQLRTLAPLRARLATLAQESWPVLEAVPSEGDETFSEHLATFRLGLVLAVTEHARPRATRMGDLHRGDEATLTLALGQAFGAGAAVETVRMLVRLRALTARAGRFSVRWDALEGWDDPAARLVVELFTPWRHDPGLLVLLDRLLADDRWHPVPLLAETLASAVFRRAFSAGAKADLARHLAMMESFPGFHRRELRGVAFIRLTAAARRAFGAAAPHPAPPRTPLLVQPNLQLVAQLGTDLATLARLGRLARLVSAGNAAVFALDEAAVRRTASEGFSGGEMLRFLEGQASHGVPATVARALADWARARGTARLLTGTVLVGDVPQDELERLAPGTRLRPLAPGVWLVPTDQARLLATALRKAGVCCEATDDADPEAWADEPDPWRVRAERIASEARRETERLGRS